MNYKKKVLFWSNNASQKTGFGGFIREVMFYLYKTGKYDLTLFGSGARWEEPEFDRFPWKSYGTLPMDQNELNNIQRDPNLARMANYGQLFIDKVLKIVKPDVLIASEDIWSHHFSKDKKWFGKFPFVSHTTLDSRPILQMGIDMCKATPYFFSWADFATKELHKLGYTNAKTLRGSVNTNAFKRLSDDKKREIRARANIPADAYCMGMLSRNQLRKSFPNIITAYKEFKAKNPEIKNTRLLFFTHYSEGWNIQKLIEEHGIDNNEVLATYKCRATGKYYIMPFAGQDINNPETGQEKTLTTVNSKDGLSESQINEWYNILDVYIHAFTSGGQERGIQEAKLCELITLVTNYSCGEDNCVEEAYSLPLDWEEYREPDSQFIKATTKPYSIVKQLEKVYRMDAAKKRDWGRNARQWVLDNFSIEVVGKQFEDLIDSLPITNYDFIFEEPLKNPAAQIDANLPTEQFIKECYDKILMMDTSSDKEGPNYWKSFLKENQSVNPQLRDQMLQYFRGVANQENSKLTGGDFSKILGPEEAKDRVLITIPESLGDCLHVTALLRDARERYSDKKIYIATKPTFFDVFNPLVGRLIDYVIEFRPEFDNVYALEGYGGNKKYFEIILSVHFPTQRNLSYIHNAADKSAINLDYPDLKP